MIKKTDIRKNEITRNKNKTLFLNPLNNKKQ